MKSQRPPDATAPATIISLTDRRCLRVDRARGTMQEAWELYCAQHCLEKLRPASRPVYRQAALEAIARFSESHPTRGQVQAWLDEMMLGGRAKATCNKLLRALKSITEQAMLYQSTHDIRLRNAFRSIRTYRLPPKEKRAASFATVRRLLELARNPLERLAIRLAAFYGLRKGELLGLQPDDVRSDNGILRLMVERERGPFGLGPRKNSDSGKPHIVRIEGDGETAGVLLSLCRLETRLSFAHRMQRELAETYLFPWGHLYPDSLIARWRRDPGVSLPPGDAWHALRHYGATVQAAQPGTSMATLQAWLGDSTITAAHTYMGQVRGTTEGGGSAVLRAFAEQLQEVTHE